MSNTNRVNSFNDFKNAMPHQINEYFSNKKLEELSIHELVYTYLNVNWNVTKLKNREVSTSLHDLVENIRASYNNNRTRTYTPLLGCFMILDQLGSIVNDPNKPLKNGIKQILDLHTYDEKTIQYLLALRNGLIHDGSLTSRAQYAGQYHTIFRLEPTLATTIEFPSTDWNGVFENELSIYCSKINSKRFFDEVLIIIDLVKEALLDNRLNLKISDEKEFFYKFLF
ncbi:hypothetical protein [Acinetobacter sp. ANC5681]|jgi:hypothetical protein|uniref:hypothetical protein n=1 Tax=Acinetobacter sp. ANC5681 TaxID=2929504 RepID=UPI00201AA074|nr:hypothetical protein [Acinetobacter sp. ANC5681]